MEDSACTQFLQSELPKLHYRWKGFRKVRRQVCRRIARRYQEQGLNSVGDYQQYLQCHAEEWEQLRSYCQIGISRFYRDRGIFQALSKQLLLPLAAQAVKAGRRQLHCWSLGCASGEEPYTLNLIWQEQLQRRFPNLGCQILATDANRRLLTRARCAQYPYSSLKDLPAALRNKAFIQEDGYFRLDDRYRQGVTFAHQDLLCDMPEGPFDLIFCRNLVFTYFNDQLQTRVLEQLIDRLRAGGALLTGIHERCPAHAVLAPWPGLRNAYRKTVGQCP